MRRILNRAVLAVALALTGAATGVEVASPATPARAAVVPASAGVGSTIDGPITRAEIIERAQYWVDNQPGTYSPTGFSPDRTNSRTYRRDCSGFVDMAWHLGTDHWTGTLATVSTPISRSELAAGDILLAAAGHVILFDRWEPDRVHFSYYSFGATSTRHVRHASMIQETFDGRPNGDYRARRYTRVVEVDEASASPSPPASPSPSAPSSGSAPPSPAPTSPSRSVPPSAAGVR